VGVYIILCHTVDFFNIIDGISDGSLKGTRYFKTLV